jgi:hypothetical protein
MGTTKSKKKEGGRNVIDSPVVGPVSLGAGGSTAYLIYQLATGEVYVTSAKSSSVFPKRQSLVCGQGGLPSAAAASGPAIAFDPGRSRIVVAYATADGTEVVVVSSDPALSTGWTVDAVIPLQGNPLLPGMGMISGTFEGTNLTVLYAVAASSKIIWASSFGNWSGGFQSVTQNGQPLNLPSASGVTANLRPGTSEIALGFTVPNQYNAFVSSNAPNSISEFPTGEGIPGRNSLTPAVTLEPDNGAWNVFVNIAQTVYYVTHYGGTWQPAQPLDSMDLSMGGPPAAVWRTEWELYVACVDRLQELAYDVIALGAKGGRHRDNWQQEE